MYIIFSSNIFPPLLFPHNFFLLALFSWCLVFALILSLMTGDVVGCSDSPHLIFQGKSSICRASLVKKGITASFSEFKLTNESLNRPGEKSVKMFSVSQ